MTTPTPTGGKEKTKNTKKKMSVEEYIKTHFGKYDEAMKKLADA